MKPSRIRLAALAAVALVGAGSVGALTVLDGGSPEGGEDEYQPQVREELLQDVRPDPDCPDAGESPTPGEDQVLVVVARVVEGCLRYGSEVVAESQVEDRLEQLRAEPDVVAADRAVERRPGASGGRARQGQPHQWALAPEHLDGERVRSLWPADAPEVRVAVIDTAIDDQHDDLAGQIVEQAPWVHLYRGDYDTHGTHVAGIVAASDDGAGVVGLTPAARLMDVQYWDGDEDGDGDNAAGPSGDLGEYVRWSVDHGADVVNMSIQGADPSDTELTAMLYAELRGVVVVGISGNCGAEDAGVDRPLVPDRWEDQICRRRHDVRYPAGYHTVLGVGNHTEDGERSDTSSANATVDLVAPGADIVSTCLSEPSDRRHTCSSSGTSMAAPFVSATAALLRARHPDATPAAIRSAITRSARTPEGRPDDRRSDDLGWGYLDPAAAARYLDEHPGGTQATESPEAGRTHAAFKDNADGRVYAFDDGILHPVHEVGTGTSVLSVDWSADRSQLVGAVDEGLFLWNGPGSELDREVFEAECDHCSAAFVERPSGSELIAAIGNDDLITHFDPDTLGEGGTVELQLPGPGDGTVLHGDANGRLVVATTASDGSSGPDALWLVDPLTGEDVARHRRDGNVDVSAVAVDATGDRIAYVGGQRGGPCGHTDEVYLLEGEALEEVANPGLPTSDLGELKVDDVFFNGGVLYATMTATEAGGGGDHCTDVGSAGLWRLDRGEGDGDRDEGGDGDGDGDGGWEQVDARPVQAVRPVEGMTEEPRTGRITIAEDRRGTFEPTGAPAAEALSLGADLSGLWATPTRAEVDLTDTTSPPPVTTTRPSGGGGAGGGDHDGPAPRTVERAVARFEQYLHALGEGDIDTICEIAGPGAQRAEDQGFGPCESTYGVVLEMISPEQAEALRTATVDPGRVQVMGTGGESSEVHVPVEAVVADVTFTEEDLGSYTLAYQDGNWFIVD